MKRTASIAAILAILVLLLPLAGCNKVTQQNYDRVQSGMSVDQVKDILGEPATTSSAGGQVGPVGGSVAQMEWRHGDQTITVHFLNGKVVAKEESNL